MIKKIFVVITLWGSPSLSAQVGIGTTTPQAALEVRGNTLIQRELQLETLPFATPNDENFKLLTRLTNSTPKGQIAILDVDGLQVAPVNVINYRFTNISLDNLSDVDLQYSADKYIVGLSNFRYVGDPIQKTTSNNRVSVGNFVTRTFIKEDTWHLEIRNRFLDLDSAKSLEYYVTLVVYDKSYYRNLPKIVTDLKGSNTGTAEETPNLY